MELEQRSELVDRLRAEVERSRAGSENAARQQSDADLHRLVAAIGAPLVQWHTQAHLHRSGSAAISVDDALDVGARLVRLFGEFGVQTTGAIGEVVPFDPDRHDPLSAAAIAPSRPVVIRVVGLSCRGRMVRKAAVDLAEGET